MANTTQTPPDHSETMLLIVGVGAAILAFFMPAVVFKGTGNTVHDLAIIEKLPVMSAIAFAGLAFCIASRFMGSLQKYAETATVVAILLLLMPALWGFIAALDAWSGLRAMILQIAGTRSVRIDPGAAYVPLFISAGLLALSLRLRRGNAGAAAAA